MRKLMTEELEQVSGGTGDVPVKGNNGWGNGAEGINPGSDEGGTAGSKFDEHYDPADPNEGPQGGNFTTR